MKATRRKARRNETAAPPPESDNGAQPRVVAAPARPRAAVKPPVAEPDVSTQEAPDPLRALPIACFVLSGFSGLLYEVAWIRRASLVFGSATFAVSTVLAVFFLGLASGSYLFGRLGQRTTRPLRTYAILELALGIIACATPGAFDMADGVYGHLYRALGSYGWPLFAARILLVALVLLPATVLMGGTLPLFCRQYVVRSSTIARSVGILYALNTLGAAAGCLATGLLLLPRLGLSGTVFVGASLNVLCAGVVGLSRFSRLEVPATALSATRSIPAASSHRWLSALCFAAGFIALGGEVLWTRYLGLLLRSTVHSYTLTLAAVLVGIVLGSLLASALVDRLDRRAWLLGACMVAWGLLVLGLMLVPATVWRGAGTSYGLYFLLLLPPAVVSGASFPLLVRMAVSDPSRASVEAGRMAALNIVGGVAGSLLVGFVGLPLFGLSASLLVVTGLSVAAGLLAWSRLDTLSAPLPRRAAMALSLAAWLVLPRVMGTRLPADLLGDREALIDFQEGLGADLSVLRSAHGIELQIDRWWQGEDRKNHQTVAAHVPMLLHRDPRRVLVVGAGTGQTASRFLLHDVERVDCVDIEPTLFDFIRRHFDSEWMRDERVTLLPEDGRNYLLHTDASYDLVSLEVGQVFRAGISAFYTTEFYHRARQRLLPGGLFTQFVPIAFFRPEELRGVVRTFLDAFPESVLWYNRAELLLVGVNGEKVTLGETLLERLSKNTRVRDDLAFSQWGGAEEALNRPEVFLAGFLVGPRGLADLSAGAPIYRDDLPVLDYATASVEEEETRELPILDLLRPRLEPVSAILAADVTGLSAARIEEIRQKNLGEIAATALLRRAMPLVTAGDYAGAIPILEDALGRNEDDFESRRLLADTLTAAGRQAQAIPHYEAALRLRPEDADAEAGFAQCLHRMGQLDRAIEHYLQAIAARPKEANLHNLLGVALGQRGMHAQAAGEFTEALRIQPDFKGAKDNLAMARQAASQAPRR